MMAQAAKRARLDLNFVLTPEEDFLAQQSGTWAQQRVCYRGSPSPFSAPACLCKQCIHSILSCSGVACCVQCLCDCR